MNAGRPRGAALAGAVLLLALAGCRREDPPIGRRPGDRVVSFDPERVASIEILRGPAAVRLARGPRGWVSRTLFDHPADEARVETAIRCLEGLVIGQLCPGGDGLLPEFGLAAAPGSAQIPGVPAAGPETEHFPREVILRDAGGGELARVAFGFRRPPGGPPGRGRASQYLRAGGGPVVLCEPADGHFPIDPLRWIDTRLCDLDWRRVERLETTLGGETRIRTFPEDAGIEGEEDSFALRRQLLTVQHLRAAGVADPSLPDSVTGRSSADRMDIRCRDGRRIRLWIGAEDPGGAGHYLGIRLEYEPPEPPPEAAADFIAHRVWEMERSETEARVRRIAARVESAVYLVSPRVEQALRRPSEF